MAYINTSRKTVIIAEGIALYAAYMDLSPTDLKPNSASIRQAWLGWEATKPSAWVEFVKKEQYYLFDRVNGLV